MKIFRLLFALSLYFAVHPFAFGWVWNTPPGGDCNVTSEKRSHVFYVGENVSFNLTTPARYEVRDYYGNVVDQGNSQTLAGTSTVNVNVTKPGWYKLYLYGAQDNGYPWGSSFGGTNFVIFRNNANFPALPGKDAFSGWYPSEDEPTRDVTGMGPQRLFVENANDPDQAIARLEQDIAVERAMYLPFDPARKRALLVAFPNGVYNTDGSNSLDGLHKIVDHFKNDVQYWEGRNEPNGYCSGSWFAANEMKYFYQTVKSVAPTLKVVGPAIVSVHPDTIPWLNDFFGAGGAQCIDAFSFHAYNCANGDFWLARTSLNAMHNLLASAGIPNIEVWQTEQGYFAACYGSYQPRLQGRWTMLQQMMFEQYGIPKEHNVIWYDRSHGFWDFPCWWENDDTSLNPTASLMRVWSEEVYGLNFNKAYDFGATANDLYIGNLFTNADGSKAMAAFMSAGNPQGSIQLSISRGTSVHVVTPFGEESDLPVVLGRVTLPVSELPVYVELAAGQQCEVAPRAYGENLALRPGVQVIPSCSLTHPYDPSIPNDPSKLVNGILENQKWTYNNADHPWMGEIPQNGPLTLEVDLPNVESISDVVIHAGVPWQWDGTLLDYQLQYWNGLSWTEIEHVSEPTKTFLVYSPTVHCGMDSFFSDRYTFEHHFLPVITGKIRLLINQATSGGRVNLQFDYGLGLSTTPAVLREIAIYKTPVAAPAPVVAPQILVQPLSKLVNAGDDTALAVVASASSSATYVWQKDQQVIPNSNSPTLPIMAASEDSQGVYSVTITDAGGAVVSNPATVLLNTPLNAWIIQQYPQAQLSDIPALLQAAPDGDGISALQKYFFNLRLGAPAKMQNLPRPAKETVNGVDYATLSYVRNPSASDVQVIAESTADLASGQWSAVQPDLTETVTSTDGTVTEQLKFRAENAAAKFIRLRLQTAQTASRRTTPSAGNTTASAPATAAAATASPKVSAVVSPASAKTRAKAAKR